MPIIRTLVLTILALLLYFFANQTQVGWLYVMSALIAAIILASFLLNRVSLRGLSGDRKIGDSDYTELFETETVRVKLSIQNSGRTPAAQVIAIEHCPLADPESVARDMEIFIPALPVKESVSLAYESTIYRRGVHHFPDLGLESRAPFGLFLRRRSLSIPTAVLVYPELRRLNGLALLDRQPSVQRSQPRPGLGTEVIGIRPYRPGDSPRHIHWRSTARSGQLITKEFVDETQPGLTLALDLYPYHPAETESKEVPFEWMIKVAASIGDYAQGRGYPVHLLVDEASWPAPAGPLTRTALLEFLARVFPAGSSPLSQLLNDHPIRAFTAALFPLPSGTILPTLIGLHHRGVQLLVVLVDPSTFPSGGPPAGPVESALRAAGVAVQVIRFGDDWAAQLGGAADPWPGSAQRSGRVAQTSTQPVDAG